MKQRKGEFKIVNGIEYQLKSLTCGTLLFCGNLKCDLDVFQAINDSGIIYDGGVVVVLYYSSSVVLVY